MAQCYVMMYQFSQGELWLNFIGVFVRNNCVILKSHNTLHVVSQILEVEVYIKALKKSSGSYLFITIINSL